MWSLQATARLVGWLKRLGIAYVLDLHPARSLALQATAQDFVRRYRHAHQRGADSDAAMRSAHRGTEEPSRSAEQTTATASAQGRRAGSNGAVAPQAELPILASACPGVALCSCIRIYTMHAKSSDSQVLHGPGTRPCANRVQAGNTLGLHLQAQKAKQLQAHAPPVLLSALPSQDADTMWLRAAVGASVAR